MLSDSEEQELLENANTLEGWACGLLDQIKKEDEAMKLISHVPHVKMRTRRCADNGHLEFEMWEGSTLDEAIQVEQLRDELGEAGAAVVVSERKVLRRAAAIWSVRRRLWVVLV